MDRRLPFAIALCAALLLPVAASAQPVAGGVLVVPGTFGTGSCSKAVTITWTSELATYLSTDVYRILVSTGSSCTTGTSTNQLGSDITATALTQSQLTTAGAILAAIGVSDCTTAATTAYLCIEQWATPILSGATAKGTSRGSVKLEVLPPPVPVIGNVASGDGALFVTWADGTATGVDAVTWDVTATPRSGTSLPVTVTFTSSTNQRLGGLVNNVTYDVTVVAVSAGGNRSAASPAVAGTPAPVYGFWEIYKDPPYSGREVGGCGGGPAGLVSLLGVALGLRLARRRS